MKRDKEKQKYKQPTVKYINNFLVSQGAILAKITRLATKSTYFYPKLYALNVDMFKMLGWLPLLAWSVEAQAESRDQQGRSQVPGVMLLTLNIEEVCVNLGMIAHCEASLPH